MTIISKIFRPIIQRTKHIHPSSPNVSARSIKTPFNTDVFEKTPVFQKLTPKEINSFNEQVDILKSNNFEGLDLVKVASNEDKVNLKNDLIQEINWGSHTTLDDESNDFSLMATGNKPSFLTSGISQQTANLFKSNGYDVVKKEFYIKNRKIVNTLILDKKNVKKVIENNLDLYQKRLNLSKYATVDKIYNTIISKKNPLLEKEKDDLLGLTLGFPRDNSILYNLHHLINKKGKEFNNENFKDIFTSNDSPYKNFSKDFKKHVLEQIDNMKLTEDGFGKGSGEYLTTNKMHVNARPFVVFVDEPKAFGEIVDKFRNATLKLKQINEANAKQPAL